MTFGFEIVLRPSIKNIFTPYKMQYIVQCCHLVFTDIHIWLSLQSDFRGKEHDADCAGTALHAVQ